MITIDINMQVPGLTTPPETNLQSYWTYEQFVNIQNSLTLALEDMNRLKAEIITLEDRITDAGIP